MLSRSKQVDSFFIPKLSEHTSSGFKWDIQTTQHVNDLLFLERYGYKVYYQNDENGIISEIFKRIGYTDKRFVEFGVENGLESNTHYLLLGWKGLWIEGNSESYSQILVNFQSMIKNGQLKVVNDFITRDNINKIFEHNYFLGEIDLLSIDIDGNDYHVLKSIDVLSPRVIIIEYNGKLPPEVNWVMEYDANYQWDDTDKHGASLTALVELAL